MKDYILIGFRLMSCFKHKKMKILNPCSSNLLTRGMDGFFPSSLGSISWITRPFIVIILSTDDLKRHHYVTYLLNSFLSHVDLLSHVDDQMCWVVLHDLVVLPLNHDLVRSTRIGVHSPIESPWSTNQIGGGIVLICEGWSFLKLWKSTPRKGKKYRIN